MLGPGPVHKELNLTSLLAGINPVLLLDYSPELQILVPECGEIIGADKAVANLLAKRLSKMERGQLVPPPPYCRIYLLLPITNDLEGWHPMVYSLNSSRDGSRQEVAGQPGSFTIVVITPDGGFVMCGRCSVSCALDCTGH